MFAIVPLLAKSSPGLPARPLDFGPKWIYVAGFIVVAVIFQALLPRISKKRTALRLVGHGFLLLVICAGGNAAFLSSILPIVMFTVVFAIFVRQRRDAKDPHSSVVYQPAGHAVDPALPARAAGARPILGTILALAVLVAGSFVAFHELLAWMRAHRLHPDPVEAILSSGRVARAILEMHLLVGIAILGVPVRRMYVFLVASGLTAAFIGIDLQRGTGAAAGLIGLSVAILLVLLFIAIRRGVAIERLTRSDASLSWSIVPAPMLFLPGAQPPRDVIAPRPGQRMSTKRRRIVKPGPVIVGAALFAGFGGWVVGFGSPLAFMPCLGVLFLGWAVLSGATALAGRWWVARRLGLEITAAAFGFWVFRRRASGRSISRHQSWLLFLGDISVAPKAGMDFAAQLLAMERGAVHSFLVLSLLNVGFVAAYAVVSVFASLPILPLVWATGAMIASLQGAGLFSRRLRTYEGWLRDPGPEGKRVRALIELGLESEAGTRPSSWSRTALADVSSVWDGSLVHAAGCYYRYVEALDRGDERAALAWINHAMSCSDVTALIASPLRATIFMEAAFMTARAGNDPATARELAKIGAMVWTEPHRRARVEAMLKIAEGDRKAATKWLRKANEAAHWWGDSVSLTLDEALQQRAAA